MIYYVIIINNNIDHIVELDSIADEQLRTVLRQITQHSGQQAVNSFPFTEGQKNTLVLI